MYPLIITKVAVELTSDSKDFKTALARMQIDEMKGTKLISLPTLKKGNLTAQHKRNPKEPPVDTGFRPPGGVTSHQGVEVMHHHQRKSPRADHQNGGGTMSHQPDNLRHTSSQDEVTP